MESCEALSVILCDMYCVILCDIYFCNDALLLRNLLTFETRVK